MEPKANDRSYKAKAYKLVKIFFFMEITNTTTIINYCVFFVFILCCIKAMGNVPNTNK